MRNNTVVALVFATILGMAGSVSAQQGSAVGSPFCRNIDTVASRISVNMTDRDKKIADFRSKFSGKKSDRWAQGDTRLAEARTAGDDKRDGRYEKLLEKAQTDAEKAAVATFQSAVDSAVATRRASVDAAIKAYREGIDAALSSHAGTLDSAQTSFRTEVDAAMAIAKSSCSTDPSKGAEIRATLQEAVKSAQAKFQTARQDASLEGTRAALAKTRNDAIQKAFADFRTTLESARATLEAAFEA